tara:strand:+ start:169 stop:579 length:411 start_codon:yes stop_codon:yes gene_type:complete
MRELLKVDISNLRPALIDAATKVSDQALDDEYGYGISTNVESFGYQANRMSAIYALHEFFNGNSHDIDDIESISSAIHDGWSYAAYHIDDVKYQTHPLKRSNRLALADIPYSMLSEEEKTKDRVVARAIINLLKSY